MQGTLEQGETKTNLRKIKGRGRNLKILALFVLFSRARSENNCEKIIFTKM
jgi:hypothetical protein